MSDLSYSLFPVIAILMDDYNDLGGGIGAILGMLNIDTFSIFLSTGFPLFIICIKSIVLARALRKEVRNRAYGRWKVLNGITDTIDDANIIRNGKLHGLTITHSTLKQARGEIYDAVSQQSDIDTEHIPIHCKLPFSAVAVMYICFGVILRVTVPHYISNAKSECASIAESQWITENQGDAQWVYNESTTTLTEAQRNRLRSNPELFLWDQCLYKVYPFTFDD